MVIASRFLHRFGQIMIRFNRETNKLKNLKISELHPKLYHIKVKKEKKKLDLALFSKKSISCIITCSFNIFRSIFTNLDFF